MEPVAEWKGEKGDKATPAQEGDIIREVQRMIAKKQLHAELIDKRPAGVVANDTCTHCNSCPCMFIG